ncbi:hypothetical protein H6F32_17380 [Anabaena sp. FACHB-1237]|uniref:hypothetical protein n=1 Tax=Anabaena sp. FACHB-1237 TaxID=2692769 RepID=UPI00168191BC|nr:hypothetical protein [Anabaena sp. FACHB-1237]MBD2139299.1 hypothetical protein [Anabaena sp. FACHB-1237]
MVKYSCATRIQDRTQGKRLIIVIPWFRETLQAKPFAQKSDKIWGGGISWLTATSYDATQALALLNQGMKIKIQ